MKWTEEVSIIGLADNICSPCWSELGREVPAVVAFETHDTVTKHIESMNYCGHHAEVLSQEGLAVDQRGGAEC
jgi:hypothetical protein